MNAPWSVELLCQKHAEGILLVIHRQDSNMEKSQTISRRTWLHRSGDTHPSAKRVLIRFPRSNFDECDSYPIQNEDFIIRNKILQVVIESRSRYI